MYYYFHSCFLSLFLLLLLILYSVLDGLCAGGPGWVAARGRARFGRGNRLGRTREIATARSARGDAVRARAQRIARDIPFTERTVGQARAAATRDPCRATGSVFARGGEGFPCPRSELVFLCSPGLQHDSAEYVPSIIHTVAAVHIIIIIITVVFRERARVCAAVRCAPKKIITGNATSRSDTPPHLFPLAACALATR